MKKVREDLRKWRVTPCSWVGKFSVIMMPCVPVESHTMLMEGKFSVITMHACLLSPVLCDPMDCSPSGSSVHGDSPGKNIGVGCHFLRQGIFQTQGSKPPLNLSPALAGRLFTTSITWQVQWRCQFSPNWYIGLTKSLSKSHKRFCFNINRLIALIFMERQRNYSS